MGGNGAKRDGRSGWTAADVPRVFAARVVKRSVIR